MRKNVWVLVIGILFLLVAGKTYAQSNVTINPASFRDSMTFVNLKYVTSSSSNEYLLTLRFAGISESYQEVQVNWGDGTESPKKTVETATTTSFSTTYKKEGCFPIQMYLFPGSSGMEADTLYAWALNTDLFLSYTLGAWESDKSFGCLSYGSDTLLLHFTSSNNPPLTRYEINISCNVPMLHSEGELGGVLPVLSPSDIDLGNNWVHACWANQEEGRRDSIWLIFTEATGVEGAEIKVNMICEYTDDKGKGDYLEKKCHQTETVYLFDKPDLKQIFRQDSYTPFPDTIEGDFSVCAPGKPNEFGFYGDWFSKYQTFVLSKPSPKPEDRSIFKVECYYTDDSVWSDRVIPEDGSVTWQKVSGNSEYFNDTTLTFNRAGFYMVRWEIHNQCDEEHPDTLWTSLVRDKVSGEYYTDKFRYIQVYENQEASLDYMGDSVFCLNVKDSVILVDRNRRKFYDLPPDYSLTVVDMDTRVEIEKKTLELKDTKIYKDGKIINAGADAEEVSRKGCDSTTITWKPKKPGNYKVTWERKGQHCEEGRTKVFEFHVGNVPTIKKDTLNHHFYNHVKGIKWENGKYYYCGAYEFEVPDLSKAFDACNRDIDSVRYKFAKGSKDSVLVYETYKPGSSFLFDSTANGLNYIVLNVYNGCGVSEPDSVAFTTATQPADLSIWRDSVEVAGTDTLCVNAEYKYYLHGVLPEKCKDSIRTDGSVYINNHFFSRGTGSYVRLRPRNKNHGVIKYTATGTFTEDYKIINEDFPKCSKELHETVVVMEAPDSMLYKDDKEILYCADMDTLDTRVLFKNGTPRFERATWGWKGEIAEEGRFPKLLFREGKDDTLYVNTIQSASCYFRDTLVFKPQPVPKFNLKTKEDVCVPDTLDKAKFKDFADTEHWEWSTMNWRVYKNVQKSDSIICASNNPTGKMILNEQSADSLGLIYWMQHVFTPRYSEFMGKKSCISTDTLPVKVRKPHLKILKKDTLGDKDDKYNFAEIQNNHVETKDLNQAAWGWSTGWNGADGTWDGKTPPEYTLGEKDKKLDSLLFILTAHTYCDDPISDTLVVYFPHLVINAHRDTICSTTTDYALWGEGKTTGLFVKTEELEWEIIKDATHGTLSATKGTDVKYTPGKTSISRKDTVKIKVTGTSEANIGSKSDTVLLWINPAPLHTPLAPTDTLIAIGNKINVDSIKAFKYQNIIGTRVKEVHNGSTGWAAKDKDTLVIFTWKPETDTLNNKITADITLKALPGCEDVDITGIPMMDLVIPKGQPRSNPLDMCAGEEYGVDSLFTFQGDRKDRFTKLHWENTKDGTWKEKAGTHDTIAFIAGTTGGRAADKITLTLEKQYIAYDSSRQSLSSTSSIRSFSVNVHAKPEIQFKDDRVRDTLCKDATSFPITVGEKKAGAEEWVLVAPEYIDSLRFNGQKLPGNTYTFTKDKGQEDTLYITVKQGRCTKWASEKDTLYLYRMDEVLDKSKLPTDYKVCEGGSVEIKYDGTLDVPYYWVNSKKNNGALDSTGKGLKPVYRDTSGIDGQIELHVTPHTGCDEETTFTNIEVTKKPRLNLADKSVCKTKGNDINLEITFAGGNSWSNADSVTWQRKGETARLGKSTPNATHFSYLLTDADLNLDTLHLVAALWPKTPCDKSPTYDTVKIALSGQPEIILPSSPLSLTMCQGDTLDLIRQTGITFRNAADTSWVVGNLSRTPAGISGVSGSPRRSPADTLYVPGEASGTASLTVRVSGAPGCASAEADFTVEVRAAPLPEFSLTPQSVCRDEEIELKSTTTGVTVSAYQWTVGDASYTGQTIKHTFTADGGTDVQLKQTYTYNGTTDQCVREKTRSITVNPKPTADFENPKQVAQGKEVTIVNKSTPETGLTYSWTVDGTSYTTKDVKHTFATVGSAGIALTVTTDKNCSDTKSETVDVVELPKPDFDVQVDSCGTTATFTLTGSLNGATVWWDWGTGNGFEQDTCSDMTQKIEKSYDVGYRDTTYWVTLELRNAAGTEQKKLPVRFVSRLKASFEIAPEETGCHEIVRKIVLKIEGRNDNGYIIWGDKKHVEQPGYTDSLPFEGNIVSLTHRFENTTLYPIKDTIRMHVENSCFSDADTNVLTVLPVKVDAEIRPSSGSTSICFNEDVLEVENISVGFENAHWEWKFDAESEIWVQSDSLKARHRYLTPGKYTVVLHIWDRCNSDTAMLPITVRGNDSLDFEILSRPYCTGQAVTMQFVQKGEPEFTDLRWYLYRGTTMLRSFRDSVKITRSFSSPGEYRIELEAKAEGCKDGQTRAFYINETPEAIISFLPGSVAEGCEAHTVEFQAAYRSGLRKMPRILWDFQNGVKSTELKEKVVFENEGTYNVTLTLTSDSGCVSTTQKEIIVRHTPRISFITDKSLFCLEENGAFDIRIENTSEDLDRCRFEWFKKIGTGTEESISLAPDLSLLHFENVSGTIGLRLQATDLQTGCKQDFIKEIVASDKVEARIFKDVENVCLDYPVYFAGRAENVAKAQWDMGDGGVSADTAFEYAYDRLGDKTITLRVENKDGCYDFDTMRITVYPLPVADFDWRKNGGIIEGYPDSLNLPEVDNGGVEFTNYSTVTPDNWGTELYYNWNFGDSTAINTAKNPTHRFENNGLYEVWLKATTAYGCVDSAAHAVSIDAVKGLYIPTAFAPAMPDEELGEGNSYMGSARFQPKGIGLYSYQIQVYEPWGGTCVWSSTALKNGQPAEYWDGKFNGADAPAGHYIWKVKAIFIDGTVWQNEKGKMEGMVMLIR